MELRKTFAEIGENVQCSYKKFYFILKIADVKSAFANAKMILQLSRRHFFADVKNSELEQIRKTAYHI